MFYILLIINNLFCQNTEPNAMLFNYENNGQQYVNQELDVEDFDTYSNKFILGFQWGGSFKYNIALNHNVTHGGVGAMIIGAGHYESDTYLLNGIHLAFPVINNGSWYSSMMSFEPTLLIHNENEFKTRDQDESNPIFGFKNIIGNISK